MTMGITQNKTVPKTEVITALRRVYFDYFENTKMTLGNFCKYSKINYRIVLAYFDTWENALNQADVNWQPKGIIYDKATITTTLRAVYLKHFENTKMTFKKFSTHSSISHYLILKYFGSWENAMQQAEINSRESIQLAQEDEMIKELRRVYFDHFKDTNMSLEKFLAHSKISYNRLINSFGSWSNAVHQAALNCNPRKIYTKEILRDELQRVYFLYPENTRLTIANFGLHSKISYATVGNHFGSWDNALMEAHINFGVKNRVYNKKTVIAALQQVYSLYPKNTRITMANFNLHSKISNYCVKKYFSSWENALIEAQINYTRKLPLYDTESSITILRAVYLEHYANTRMTYKNFKLHSNLPIRTIIFHFGSWRNALNKAQINYSSKSRTTRKQLPTKAKY